MSLIEACSIHICWPTSLPLCMETPHEYPSLSLPPEIKEKEHECGKTQKIIPGDLRRPWFLTSERFASDDLEWTLHISHVEELQRCSTMLVQRLKLVKLKGSMQGPRYALTKVKHLDISVPRCFSIFFLRRTLWWFYLMRWLHLFNKIYLLVKIY